MLTPTAKSQFLAGVGLWSLFWGIVQKADSLPFIGRMNPRRRVVNWVDDNKALALIATEVANFSVHGIDNPGAVTFALGGTVVNVIYVLLINPVVRRFLK